MKKVIAFAFIFLMTIPLVSCDDFLTYNDAHPELQVIATNSLLGVFGTQFDEILIMEEDDLGRVMFSYLGGTSNSDRYILAVLISQKTTETESYFYDNSNFICSELRKYKSFDSNLVMKYFSDDQLEKLKQENDWNKEINEEKLFKIPITRKKEHNISIPKQRKAFNKVSDDHHSSYSDPLTTDKNGKTLYYMRGMRYDDDAGDSVFTQSYLVMFDKDAKLIEGTGIMELTDLWDYREQLGEFKKLNGWSFSSY